MSRWFIITDMGYKETDNPPNHDHWIYDYKTDTYYEDYPQYKLNVAQIERQKNDN